MMIPRASWAFHCPSTFSTAFQSVCRSAYDRGAREGSRRYAVFNLRKLLYLIYLMDKGELLGGWLLSTYIPSVHNKTSNVVLLFYTTLEVYTKFEMVSIILDTTGLHAQRS